MPRASKINQQAETVLDALKHLTRVRGGATYPEIRDYIAHTTGEHVENVSGRMGEIRKVHLVRYTTDDDPYAFGGGADTSVRRYYYVGPRPAPVMTAPMPRITLPEGFTPDDAERVKQAALREIAQIQILKGKKPPAPARPRRPPYGGG